MNCEELKIRIQDLIAMHEFKAKDLSVVKATKHRVLASLAKVMLKATEAYLAFEQKQL